MFDSELAVQLNDHVRFVLRPNGNAAIGCLYIKDGALSSFRSIGDL
jgi:hypothetical protein